MILNYAVLIIGLLISGGLWILFSRSDAEVSARAKKYSIIFLIWGLICFSLQLITGLGAQL